MEGESGTLRRRAKGTPARGNLHAKTGTLSGHSALSGFVWLSRLGVWAQFSILDRGMSYTTEKSLEDAIVRTIARAAH